MNEISPKRCGNATKQVFLHAFVGEASGVSVSGVSALAVVLSKIKKGHLRGIFWLLERIVLELQQNSASNNLIFWLFLKLLEG